MQGRVWHAHARRLGTAIVVQVTLRDRRSTPARKQGGPALGPSAALDPAEPPLLFSDDAIFDIGDEDQNENAWAWPDTFGLGCCLAPEPTTPATPGVRFVSKGKRQRVPEDDRESGR